MVFQRRGRLDGGRLLLTNRPHWLRRSAESTFAATQDPPQLRLCRTAGERSNLALAAAASPVGQPRLLFAPLQQLWLQRPANVPPVAPTTQPGEADPLYLFACHIEWERREEPSAAWELIAAAESPHSDTRAHARALLASSQHLGGIGATVPECSTEQKPAATMETDMKAPYGLEIVENCSTCPLTNASFFCGFPAHVRAALDQVSHKSVLPAGAILFVEGQAPRGMFVLCSGKVNLSTTSREGKILILKTAIPGEALGLSSAISGLGYETTAEAATPCQLNFVDRKHLLELMQDHSEVGMHAAQCLSRDFHLAHRDIHDLVLSRSSAGKLARLLLAQYPPDAADAETRIQFLMTHEEMAQRIGSSRETVTRLLSELRKRQLIRLDGSALVIRDRGALEALAV